MSADVKTWITGIMTLANMVEAWEEAKRTVLSIEQAREKVLRAESDGKYIVGESERNLAVSARRLKWLFF